jgi:hypothetical protein
MKTLLAIMLFGAALAQAQSTGDPVIPKASTDRFLNNVRDYADGRLTPGREDETPLAQPGGNAAGGVTKLGNGSADGRKPVSPGRLGQQGQQLESPWNYPRMP